MLWIIIAIVAMFICSYGLGYYMAKINSLNQFKKAMDKIHSDALNRDLSDEYQRGHAWGLLHALKIIQESDMF